MITEARQAHGACVAGGLAALIDVERARAHASAQQASRAQRAVARLETLRATTFEEASERRRAVAVARARRARNHRRLTRHHHEEREEQKSRTHHLQPATRRARAAPRELLLALGPWVGARSRAAGDITRRAHGANAVGHREARAGARSDARRIGSRGARARHIPGRRLARRGSRGAQGPQCGRRGLAELAHAPSTQTASGSSGHSVNGQVAGPPRPAHACPISAACACVIARPSQPLQQSGGSEKTITQSESAAHSGVQASTSSDAGVGGGGRGCGSGAISSSAQWPPLQ